jgi:hypothetical protein
MYARRVLQISFAVVLAAGSRVRAEGQNTASAELRITIYDEAHLPQEVLSNSLDGLRLVLRKAKIRSRTVLGNLAAPEASVWMSIAPTPNDVHSAAPCGIRKDIALEIIGASPRDLRPGVLGMSSPFADFGLNVRIFGDHVREAARAHGESYATVLSFAMAHEIGHVLLRSGAHTTWGIMAREWTEFEYGQMAHRGLLFDEKDAKAIKASLSVPPCSVSAPASTFRAQPRSDEGTGSPALPQTRLRRSDERSPRARRKNAL